jgi:ATP-dependent Clp protease ATP-binding subunit ClpA
MLRIKFDTSGWSDRGVTDAARYVLTETLKRAEQRGMNLVDGKAIPLLVLWSAVMWERKIGLVAIMYIGIDRFDLARELDRLLTEMEDDYGAYHDRERDQLVLKKSGERLEELDYSAIIEPILQQAEHESRELGHTWVGTEHLALSVVRFATGPLATLLQQQSITYTKLKHAVLELLRQ